MSYESSGDIGDMKVTLFGGIKGLVSEGEELKKSLLATRPDVLFVSMSNEHVTGLSGFMKDPYEVILSDYEIIYGVHLSVYGEVMTPPPIYIESVRYGEENGVDVIGLDIDEAEFSKLYSKKVGTFDLIRHSVRKKRLLKKEFGDKSPEEFVKSWETRVNSIKALREIDAARLETMKTTLEKKLSENRWKNAFVIVDFEFYEDFRKLLSGMETKKD